MPRLRSHLRHLAPYELPEQLPQQGAEVLQLASNENFAPASQWALQAARRACEDCTRYPDPDATALREAIASLHGLDPARIVCSRGAMELIALLTSAYLEPGTNAVSSAYGYMFFRTSVALTGARLVQAPEPDMSADTDALAGLVDENTRVVSVTNPGNPTGQYLRKTELLRLRDALPESVLLIVDEAYAEFVEPGLYRPCFDLANRGPTVILRTFSKIYGLAGLRVGWGYMPSEVASAVRVVQQPNGVTAAAQAAAAAAVADRDHIADLGRRTLTIRETFTRSLMDLGLDPLPSQGNFVLLRFESTEAARAANRHLRTDGIAVRDMSGYDLPECLRITLGTENQMRRVSDSLQDWIEAGPRPAQ